MKRWIALFLALVMALGLAACGEKPAAAEQDAEIARAVSYGIVPEEMQGDYDKSVTFRQYTDMLTRVITLWDEALLPEWANITAAAAQSDEEMRREDGILEMAYALVAVGHDSPATFSDGDMDAIMSAIDEQARPSWEYPLFPTWEEEGFAWSGSGYLWGGLQMCAIHQSLVSGRAIYPFAPEGDEAYLQKPLTRRDAVCAALRFGETDPTVFEPDGVYVSLEEVDTYDKTVITDELLSAPTDLPDATQDKLPGEWQGAGLSKGKDIRNDITEYQKYRESDLIFLAENGFNFTRVFFSLSTLRFPDFPDDPRQVNENELKELDRLIAWGIEHGVHIQISVSYYLDENGNSKMDASMPSGEAEWALFRDYWTMLTRRYAGIPSRYLSFDLSNEVQPEENEDITQYAAGVADVVAAMRGADSGRVLLYSYPGNPNMKWAEAMAQLGLAVGCHPYYPQNITTGDTGAGSGDYFEPCWPMPVLPAWQISTRNAPLTLQGSIGGAELSIHVGKAGPSAYLEVFADGVLTETLALPGGEPDENGECWYGEEMLTAHLPEGTSQAQLWVRNEDAHIDTVIVEGTAGRTPIVFSSDTETDAAPLPVLIHADGSYSNAEDTIVTGEDIYDQAVRPLQELAERYGVGFMVNEMGIFAVNVDWDITVVENYHDDVLAMLEAHGLPWCYCELYNAIPKHIVTMYGLPSQWTGATMVTQTYGGVSYDVCQELLDTFCKYTMN